MIRIYKGLIKYTSRDTEQDSAGYVSKHWYTLWMTVLGTQSITMKYLETGHTFMSADSVHGSIAKKINSHSAIYGSIKDFIGLGSSHRVMLLLPISDEEAGSEIPGWEKSGGQRMCDNSTHRHRLRNWRYIAKYKNWVKSCFKEVTWTLCQPLANQELGRRHYTAVVTNRPSGLSPLANQELGRYHYSTVVTSRPSGLSPLVNQELGRYHYSTVVTSRPSGLSPLVNQELGRYHYSCTVVTSRPSGLDPLVTQRAGQMSLQQWSDCCSDI